MKTRDIERMTRHQSYQERNLPLAEAAVESIQDKIEEREAVSIRVSKHGNERELERAISNRDLMAVLSGGYAIECQGVQKDSIEILLMGHTKGYNNMYRPLHVAVSIKDNDVLVKTAYDPRSREWQWENNYETRIFYLED